MSVQVEVRRSQKNAVINLNTRLHKEAPRQVQIHGEEQAIGYLAILLRECILKINTLPGYELSAQLGSHKLKVGKLPLPEGPLDPQTKVVVPTQNKEMVDKETTETRTQDDIETMRLFAAQLWAHKEHLEFMNIALINSVTKEEVKLEE